ncbi:uncharacterized protein LOC118235162 isoform X2 [Anguilla anguilla]|uniref:uncharacterized protein LOC118235162 isoform X2 n=1 Tax=Anguilla anguilla TaxID=7936 RepID=UPI0015A920F2|nr:uncharacterized protein LOC118235162 isoform X2 [Anguilla anguilla]
MVCDSGMAVALALVSIILAISLCLNAILYSLRRRDARRKAVEEYPCPEPEAYHMDSPEVTLDQENPIYGNINPDRTGAGGAGGGGEVFYEHMTTRSREEKPPQQDVSYASLDLVVGQKRRKKHRNKQNPRPGQSRAEHPSQQDFLEVEVEVEAEPGMPCRNSSPMISRNSIYLNSHQVAMESEELERRLEREREGLMDFDNVHDDPTRFFTRANQSQAFDTDSR